MTYIISKNSYIISKNIQRRPFLLLYNVLECSVTEASMTMFSSKVLGMGRIHFMITYLEVL